MQELFQPALFCNQLLNNEKIEFQTKLNVHKVIKL